MIKTYKYKKGDRPCLDEVYALLGIIPSDAIYQDDIADSKGGHDPDNDSGESVLFLKDVTIKINISVSD
jgi:hypothetical protein